MAPGRAKIINSKSSTDSPADLIAVARIKGLPDKKGFVPVTLGGDALSNVSLPCEAYLLQPEYQGSDLKKILQIAQQLLPRQDSMIRTQLAAMYKTGFNKARVHLLGQAPQGSGDLSGYWICLATCNLKRNVDEYYVFELLGQAVYTSAGGEPVGRVSHFFDNGAHGVLEIKLEAESQTVLVPMVREYVSQLEEGPALLIPALMDFKVEL